MSTATLTNHATTVAGLYQAFGRGDVSFILNQLDDDCQWISPGEGALPQGGTYKGKEAGVFFQKLMEYEEFEVFDVYAIHQVNNNEVIALGRANVIVKTTGKKAGTDWVMHWKFNDNGKVIFFQDFFDSATAYLAYQK